MAPPFKGLSTASTTLLSPGSYWLLLAHPGSQEEPRGARRSQGESGAGAGSSQEEPVGARKSQGEPRGVRGSQEEPGEPGGEPGLYKALTNHTKLLKTLLRRNQQKTAKTQPQRLYVFFIFFK